MSTQKSTVTADPADISKEQLIHDFKTVVADAEALLKATAGQGGEALASARAHAEESIAAARARMHEAEEAMVAKTKAAAKATDEYVHLHPWQAVGVAAGVGLLVGMLIGRR